MMHKKKNNGLFKTNLPSVLELTLPGFLELDGGWTCGGDDKVPPTELRRGVGGRILGGPDRPIVPPAGTFEVVL